MKQLGSSEVILIGKPRAENTPVDLDVQIHEQASRNDNGKICLINNQAVICKC